VSRPVAAGCLFCAAAVLVLWPARPVASWRLGKPKRPSARLAMCAEVCGVGCAAGLIAGPVAAVLGAAAGALLVHRMRTARATIARASALVAEVEALAGLAAELRSGRHPGAALAGVEAPPGSALDAALAGARAAATFGGDVAAALRQRADPGGMLDRLAAAWQVSESTGAPLATVAERVQAEGRATIALQERAQAELAGARATGGLLAVLPLLGVGLGQAMGGHPLNVLLHTPVGALCAGCGLALEFAGLSWVTRLAANASRP
jgi:tight adherence protein B